MNDLVKSSIESRRTAIFNAYEITDLSIIEKIEDLFNRINEFGESCADAMDFENKFASSELNQQYIQLFTEIATTCTQKVWNSGDVVSEQNEENNELEELADDINYELKSAVQPIRGRMYREAYDKARDIPVIGDVMTVKQHVDLFNKFRRKKDKNIDKNADKEQKE